MASTSGSLSKQLRKLTAASGEQFAQELLSELEFSVPMKDRYKRQQVENLLDSPPANKQDFQQRTHENDYLFDTPKQALALLDQPRDPANAEAIFCMVGAQFNTISGMDIDHVTPYEMIQARQTHLLETLNALPDSIFVNSFLNSDVSIHGNRISDFIQKDVKDGRIKGTKYFYNACYNSIDNLWLLSHAINIKKSNLPALEWLRQQDAFGEKFMHYVKNQGQLHSGIIFDRVGVVEKKFFLGIDGQPVCAGGTTLGKFARDWFKATYPDDYAMHREFYVGSFKGFKDQMNKIHILQFSDDKSDQERATIMVEQLKRSIEHADDLIRLSCRLVTFSSPTQPESEEQARVRRDHVLQQFKYFQEKNHDMLNLTDFLNKKYQRDLTLDVFLKEISDLSRDPNVAWADFRKFREEVDLCVQAASLSKLLLSWQEVAEQHDFKSKVSRMKRLPIPEDEFLVLQEVQFQARQLEAAEKANAEQLQKMSELITQWQQAHEQERVEKERERAEKEHERAEKELVQRRLQNALNMIDQLQQKNEALAQRVAELENMEQSKAGMSSFAVDENKRLLAIQSAMASSNMSQPAEKGLSFLEQGARKPKMREQDFHKGPASDRPGRGRGRGT
jgi:hypothetical protein